MYAEIKISSDQVTNGTTDNVFAAIPGLAFSFTVEEDEMWCVLGLKAVVSNAVATHRTDLDITVDGVRQGATNGLTGAASAVANAMCSVNAGACVRLTRGMHVLGAMFKSDTATDVSKVCATTFPAVLSVTRLSNNAVLAHGVDAKFQVTE